MGWSAPPDPRPDDGGPWPSTCVQRPNFACHVDLLFMARNTGSFRKACNITTMTCHRAVSMWRQRERVFHQPTTQPDCATFSVVTNCGDARPSFVRRVAVSKLSRKKTPSVVRATLVAYPTSETSGPERHVAVSTPILCSKKEDTGKRMASDTGCRQYSVLAVWRSALKTNNDTKRKTHTAQLDDEHVPPSAVYG